MRTLVLAALCGVACTVMAANAQDTETLAANPVYQNNCAKCHGKSAQGRFMAGPSLVSQKVTVTPADELREIIVHGKHRMPKFEGKLQPSEIDALIDQLRSQTKPQ